MNSSDILALIGMFVIIGLGTYYNYKFNQIGKNLDNISSNKAK